MPETPDALDQRGVIDGAGAVVPYAVWRQALDRALAALEMPGIVVVLGAADVRSTFLRDLVAGLRECGRDVTSLRAELPEPPPVAGSALVIEDAARMDAAMLEAICRPPGRRVVLVGLSPFALFDLPAPLIFVTLDSSSCPLEPLSPGTAAAPESSSRSNSWMAIASGVLGATWVAAGLLWTRAPWAPPAAPSRVAALQPAVKMPLPPGSPLVPPEPAPTEAAIAPPPPAPSASKQPGDATSATSPAPMPAGDEDRPGIGTSPEPPAVPVVAQTGLRSGIEPAPPQLQAGPSPETRQALNVPPAAAIATPPPESAVPSGSAPQLLPDTAPIRVLVSYAPRNAAARQEAAGVVRLLRGGGLAASDPAPAARVAGKAGITYFFAEDCDGARRVEHDLGETFGASRLSPLAPGEPLPRPGTIEVLVPAR